MEKILYLITQSELGGAQRYVFDLAENLQEEFDVSVAFGSPHYSSGEAREQWEKGELAGKLKERNIKYYTLKNIKRKISPLNDFLAIFKIIKLIKKLQPGIIHLNSSKISILGSLAAFLSKSAIGNPAYAKALAGRRQSKIVYTVHGWVFNEPLAFWKKIFYKYAEKFTAYFKDKIICISKLDYELAKNQLKIPEKKLTLIHHGIKPINFLTREEARRKLSQISNFQFPISNFIIGTIANLYKTKGLEYLIESVKIIISSYQLPITTIIIGDGAERKRLRKIIENYNLQNNVILAGKIDKAAELLPAFDVYVCSSVKEGFPYAVLEAMSAGLPIISTRVGGIPEMITNGQNGLLTETKNPRQLAEEIKKLIKDEKLRRKLGSEARKTVRKKFGMERMIKKTKEIYYEPQNLPF
jgi:glycosyltransferase involved in cell wall biosynthesis